MVFLRSVLVGALAFVVLEAEESEEEVEVGVYEAAPRSGYWLLEQFVFDEVVVFELLLRSGTRCFLGHCSLVLVS